MTKKTDESKTANHEAALLESVVNAAPLSAPAAEVASADPAAGRKPAQGSVPLSPEQIEELKTKAAKADEFWDRLLRATADLENYKKRAARERQEAVRYANESLLERLIPVLDNFDMAVAAANNPQNSSVESIRTGIAMISAQLKSAMADAGLEEIDAANKPFDANWHEAVSQQESGEAPEGHVLQQLRKGYKLRDRLLRPATVVIAKKPAA